MFRVFPTLTANKTQAAAYLFGVAFFSISFLVFLNASISFVVTDVIGQKHGVGDAVGTLGFADELLALVACPLWGLLSDRVGVRTVAVTGYIIIGISLISLVQSQNVYPELLLGRLGFSIGGAACSTMVTAILPAMTTQRKSPKATGFEEAADTNGQVEESTQPEENNKNNRNSTAFSVSSELTITPARFTQAPLPKNRRRRRSLGRPDPVEAPEDDDTAGSTSGTSQLAGFVGMFTGLGALLAVGIFLPLPAAIGGDGTSPAAAEQYTFYIVGAIAIAVGFCVFFGLKGLPGEEHKGLATLFKSQPESAQQGDSSDLPHVPSYYQLVRSAILLGFTDSHIALGYLGGFVARASSVCISLFIPLFVNAYFIRRGLCTVDPSEDMKESCRRAYTLASMLTGVSQLVALLSAPLFGYFNARMSKRTYLSNLPLGLGATVGIIGCVAFGLLNSPDPFSKDARDSRGKWAILAVILLGISQIAAIVCSLGLLARGINKTSDKASTSGSRSHTVGTARAVSGMTITPATQSAETAPLLPTQEEPSGDFDRSHLKGTIAGVYSLGGGAGILLLTKLGGVLFDRTSPGAPFFMLAIFNAILLAAVVGIMFGKKMRKSMGSDETDVS